MKLGDYIKRPVFWAVVAAVYLVFLLIFVAFYTSDFLRIENCLLFVPLYIFIAKASSIHFKKETDNTKNRFVIISSWAGCTAIVALFQWLIK